MDQLAAIAPWLDAELDRMWLIAEHRLRRQQQRGIRFPDLRAVEHALRVRRDKRGGGDQPELAELDRALAARVRTLGPLRAAAPLGHLARRLGLRAIEIDVLVATIAPLVDPPLGELYLLVRNVARRGVDLALIGELFELDRRRRLELLQTIDTDRPLLAWGLVSFDGGNPERAIVVVPDIIALLSGTRSLSPSLVPHVTLRVGQPDLDGLVLAPATRATLDGVLSGFATGSELPWLVLHGPAGAGRRELATRLAAATGRTTLVFDPATCHADTLALRLRQAQREALIRSAVLVIGPMPADRAAGFARELRRYPDLVMFVVDGAEPPRLATERPVHELALGVLPPAQARELWARAVPALDPTTLVDGFRLTPGDLLGAVRLAQAAARAEARTVALADLRRGVSIRLRAQLADLVERVDALHAWDELVLSDADLDRLRELIGRKRYASVVYDRWGLAKRIRYGKGMIALCSGPPGTGKTMIAGVIANELGMDLYRVDLSQVMSKWLGETEKQVARIFEIAERTQAVLLFDEADALFAKRTESDSGNDRHANLTVNYLLQRLETYPGVAMLTTNKEAALDEALQRRLSLHLRLELPEPPERARLWRSFLTPDLPGAAAIDIDWLAHRYELAGGSIKNAAVRAAFLAAGDDSPLDLALVITAVERELDDMGRVVWHVPTRAARRAPTLATDDVILD